MGVLPKWHDDKEFGSINLHDDHFHSKNHGLKQRLTLAFKFYTSKRRSKKFTSSSIDIKIILAKFRKYFFCNTRKYIMKS